MNKKPVESIMNIEKGGDLNMIDKIVLYLNCNDYEIIDEIKYLNALNSFDIYEHIQLKLNKHNQLKLTITGKATATTSSLGGITSSNIPVILEKIEKQAGIIITEDNFLNAKVTQIDVKKDKYFRHNDLSKVLSRLRELAYKNTSKSIIQDYSNEVGFSSSIVVRSTCKTVKDTLTIYNKFEELYSKRRSDKGFFDSLSSEMLETTRHILRFERRLMWKKAIKKALKLKTNEDVNLNVIFNSEIDLVQEKIIEVFGKGVTK